MRYRRDFIQSVLCLFVILCPVWTQAEIINSIDNEALEVLKQMNDYLSSQQVVAFRAIQDDDEVLDNGQKIMSSKEITFKMKRPNKFHVQRHSAESGLEMFFDGTSFTLFRKDLNFFSTVPAPSTITEVFDELENKRNIQIVARDLLRDKSNAFLLASLSSGFIVGDALVDGVLCTQLAFRSADTDIQLWITKGKQPLPKKYVITSRWITGGPQYAIRFFDWEVKNPIDNAVFIFKAPQDAYEIPFTEIPPQQEANK
jgi:hypothetical protein